MQLRAYRQSKQLTLADVAELTGFTIMTVNRHERGVNRPSVEQIEKYRKLSGGAVTFDDWVALHRDVTRAKTSAASPPRRKRRQKDAAA